MKMSARVDDHNEDPQVDVSIYKDLDDAVIQDMPWAQTLHQKLQEDLRISFLNWCVVVKDVGGVNGDHTLQWGERYSQTINDLLRDMLNDMLRVQDKTTDTIQALLEQLQGLCVALGQSMPNIGANGLCLYEEQKQLRKYIEECESALKLKKQEVTKLEKKYLNICKSLGEKQTFQLNYPPMPTPEELEKYEHNIQELETVLFERHEKFYHVKAEIMECVEQIRYVPTCDFEREILSEDTMEFTKKNMAKLDLFAEDMKKLKCSIQKEIVQLRSGIEDLWNMLDTDLKYRDDFRTAYTGNSLDILQKLEEELARCKEVKKENIQNFVEKLRGQLEALWEKCHCSEMHKRSFTYFYNDCYTEDLLALHEIEIQKWETYYKDNEHLIELLNQHKELWQKAMILEQNASGANRYKNRGGNLLQEEKERNKLSKLIPKIEADIFELCEEYKNNNAGAAFTTFDQTAEEYIEYLHEKRKNDRKIKLSAHKMQREHTPGHSVTKTPASFYGPSTSKMITPVITPSAKRKLLITPQSSKRVKNDVQRNLKTTPVTRSIPKIKVTVATRPLPAQKRKSRSSLDKRKRRASGKSRRSRGLSPLSSAESGHDTRNTTYTQFAREQLSSNEAHSTIIHEQTSPLKKTPSKVLLEVPSSRTRLTPRTPRTPLTPRTPNSQTGKSKLTTCKSNIKLLF